MNKRQLIIKYIAFDILASLLVWVSFVIYRKTINEFSIINSLAFPHQPLYYVISLLFFILFCTLTHYLTGYYQTPYQLTRTATIINTFISSIIISIAVFLIHKITDVTVSLNYFYISWIILVAQSFIITIIFRSIVSSNVRTNFRTKKWTINTLIIGTGQNALKTEYELSTNSDKNTLIGFISIPNDKIKVARELILGDISKIEDLIISHDIKEIIIASEDTMYDKALFEIINPLFKYNINILFTPRLYEIITGSAKINQKGLLPLVCITNTTMSNWETSIKRFMDIGISTGSLILLSPILAYFIIRIKLESKGSAFYSQERIGRYGKPFMIYKFRTMYVGSENGQPMLSSPNDNRITPTGSILRKYRLDEIPQFWNILKGEMSIVGPRPERQYFIDQITTVAPYYCLLYNIRPGLTSWGPIKVGYTDTLDKMINRLNYDIIYLENMSILTDIKILVYTIETLLNGKGM
jgi:exopolysaccharide biosynthesis polyprenyl glycosylphosphotransferase